MSAKRILKKGISPLIAAVLLIAFTMTIAGFMATWANQLTTTRLEIAGAGASCIGAIDVGSVSFTLNSTSSSSSLAFRIRNNADSLSLQGLRADLSFSSPEKTSAHSSLVLSDHGATDPLPVGGTAWVAYNTTEIEKPLSVSVWSLNCKEYAAQVLVRTQTTVS